MVINLYRNLKDYPAFSKQLHCKGMLFTNYECPQVTGNQPFYIECSFIIYVIRGRRIFHKNNKSWDLKEGACAFVKKGTHLSEKLGNDEWCVMAFFIPDYFLKEIVQQNRNTLHLSNAGTPETDHVVPLHVNEISNSFFSSMLVYFGESQPPPEHLLELKFKELVLSLVADKNNQAFISYLNLLSRDNQVSLEEVMLNNYTFNLALADYAKLACKSVPTFQREFKKIFKTTPARWVMDKRLALATDMLRNTSFSVAQVTFECGFENTTHFSRVFKERMGQSPLQFRTGLQAV